MTININVMTLFPEMFPGSLDFSLSGKARKNNLWNINTINLRDFAKDKRRTVDDSPFGGGEGMIIKPEILSRAIKSLKNNLHPKILLSPRGEVFNQNLAKEFAKLDELTLICGRYEGIDQRVIEKYNLIEVSLGDYILSGGEIACQVLLDVIIRLLPGVINNEQSVKNESFENGLLEYPQYTKPRIWEGIETPKILLSGHHEKIKKWRIEQSLKITEKRRPDLWIKYLDRQNKDI